MTSRELIIDYSRGNSLNWFWRFYRLQRTVDNRFLKDIFKFLMSRSANHHGGYIGSGAKFEDVPTLPHGIHGIFISRYASIGKDCWIYQNVTIGEINRKAPVIGDGCFIGAGAIIIGNIRIGNNVKIGAGVVVNRDIADGCTVVSQPPRIIEKK